MHPLTRRRFLSSTALTAAAWSAPRTFGAESRPISTPALAAALQPFVDNHQIAGGVGLVSRGGRVEAVAVGWADLANHRPQRLDDLFWIASMTKPMAAVCILMLQDEGKLSVEDPVEKHLPAFKSQWMLVEKAEQKRVLVPAPRPITLRDLLTHTAGLGEFTAPRFDATLAELCVGYAREPLQFPPGSKWSYSNPAINTLGRIVEVVSGRSFSEFLAARLLVPLGMRDTTFWPSATQARRLSKSYKVGNGGQLEEVPIFFVQGGLSDHRRTAIPAGGLFSTARDIARFYDFMLYGGQVRGRRLLSEAALRQLTSTQTGDIVTGFVPGMSWGFGFQVVKEPQGVTARLSRGTFGHGGAYGTQSWGDPVRKIGLVLMIQRSGLPNGDASEMRRAFQEAALAGL